MREPTDVEATYREGRFWVRAFTRQGKRLPVVSQGRQWTQAGELHTLVMTTRERVYELAYAAGENQWYIVMASEQPLSA